MGGPTNRGVGIVAQALSVGDGHKEQIECQRRAIAAVKVVVANQAVVNPVEAGRHLADTIRSNQSFLHHRLLDFFPGHGVPEYFSLGVAGGGRSRRCDLVTYCP